MHAHRKDTLQKQLPPKRNVSSTDLEALKKSIDNDLTELESKQDELSKASQKVSLKQLYEAVTKVQESSSEQCPACQTSLTKDIIVNIFAVIVDDSGFTCFHGYDACLLDRIGSRRTE